MPISCLLEAALLQIVDDPRLQQGVEMLQSHLDSCGYNQIPNGYEHADSIYNYVFP